MSPRYRSEKCKLKHKDPKNVWRPDFAQTAEEARSAAQIPIGYAGLGREGERREQKGAKKGKIKEMKGKERKDRL